MINVMVWICIVAVVVDMLFNPLLFGEPRKPLSYWSWLFSLPFSILIIYVCLKFVGFI